MEAEAGREDPRRHLGHPAREPTMRMAGAALTVGAPCRATGRGQFDDELLLVEVDGIEMQTGPVGEDGGQERGDTHEQNSTNGDETIRAIAPVVLPPPLSVLGN